MPTDICFCATGKTGLGHLRRLTNIAQSLHQLAPELRMRLLTNASGEGLAAQELALYQQIDCIPREQMAAHLHLQQHTPQLVVVDTAVLPGLERVNARRALILRETITRKLHCFALPGSGWDAVLLPHPADDWRPDATPLNTRELVSVGWIYRQPAIHTTPLPLGNAARADTRQLLIASGAGGGGDRWTRFNDAVMALLQYLHRHLPTPLEVIQVQGPRATNEELLPGIDRIVQPGSRLNELFPQADLVISAMGYNSALELAACDVPVLMMAKPTTYDDQRARALRWHGVMGWAYQASQAEAAHRWVAKTLVQRQRRDAVAIDGEGALRAAQALLRLIRE